MRYAALLQRSSEGVRCCEKRSKATTMTERALLYAALLLPAKCMDAKSIDPCQCVQGSEGAMLARSEAMQVS
jgi:hypothetical protein